MVAHGTPPSGVETIPYGESLRRDAALLRTGGPAFRVARIADRSLSIGVAQPAATPAAQRAAVLGIPVLRRDSGGTGVLVQPGDLVWSLVLPRRDHRVGSDYVRAYARLGGAVVQFLGEIGPAARWEPATGGYPEFCLLSERGQVLTVGREIIGGAAQHRTRDALLHHGILPWSLDRPMIERLFDVPVSVTERRLGSLEQLRTGVPPEGLAERLHRAFEREFALPTPRDPLTR
jgi:lipoate-protein ligase A